MLAQRDLYEELESLRGVGVGADRGWNDNNVQRWSQTGIFIKHCTFWVFDLRGTSVFLCRFFDLLPDRS